MACYHYSDVERHAEELRDKFVKHDGKEKLVVDDWTTPFYNWDIGMMCGMFIPLTQEHMANKEVQEWLMPRFSTTTDQDKAIFSMVMMATMKEYFSYEMYGRCGFPSVTLLGEAADWEMIMKRLDKFAEYGEEPTVWSNLLEPVLRRFITTFYIPDSNELKEFWMRAVYSAGKFGSGLSPTFGGWLTAFMYWTKEGGRTRRAENGANGKESLVLDGEIFPLIAQSMRGVPVGVVEIPVTVQAIDLGLSFDTRIVADSMGMAVKKGDKPRDGTTVQPVSGWWMLEYGREPR
jgi:hypothetical protein